MLSSNKNKTTWILNIANTWQRQLYFVYLQTKWQSLIFYFILPENLLITLSTQTSIPSWTFMCACLIIQSSFIVRNQFFNCISIENNLSAVAEIEHFGKEQWVIEFCFSKCKVDTKIICLLFKLSVCGVLFFYRENPSMPLKTQLNWVLQQSNELLTKSCLIQY